MRRNMTLAEPEPFAGRYSCMDRITTIKIRTFSWAALALTLAMNATAFAQAQSADPKACADGANNPPNQTLSDKLDRSGGVICPPNVDPHIKAPTPNTGNMPVIPPPGTPGGNQSVQPK
jgi:hypothetical protein